MPFVQRDRIRVETGVPSVTDGTANVKILSIVWNKNCRVTVAMIGVLKIRKPLRILTKKFKDLQLQLD